jgi:hypothetical protein
MQAEWSGGVNLSGGARFFPTHPDQPSLMYNGCWVSFPDVERLRDHNNHPPHLDPRLKKKE